VLRSVHRSRGSRILEPQRVGRAEPPVGKESITKHEKNRSRTCTWRACCRRKSKALYRLLVSVLPRSLCLVVTWLVASRPVCLDENAVPCSSESKRPRPCKCPARYQGPMRRSGFNWLLPASPAFAAGWGAGLRSASASVSKAAHCCQCSVLKVVQYTASCRVSSS
jgi:hypothetical protein